MSTSEDVHTGHEQPLDQSIAEPELSNLGSIALRTDIKTSLGPFQLLPEYTTQYPETVTCALANLYAEYNRSFAPLIEANREWDTDYQFAMTNEGLPVNYFVQIDMVGLTDNYLEKASHLDEKQVREDLRGKIFEIENSLAMYQLLQRLFSRDNETSLFDTRFRESLDDIRRMHNMPIALLAVTEQKHNAMRESEFGKQAGEELTNGEVMDLTGFDAFFGPEDFVNHLRQNQGESGYLLYVRSSDPIGRLRNPDFVFENPLLSNDELRRIIKAHAITFNIDNPQWPIGSPARINDSKAYLYGMQMADVIHSENDVNVEAIEEFLLSKGVNQDELRAGKTILRAKPMQASYGCYGHVRGSMDDKRFRQELRRELRRRGPYIIQPEMNTPLITNQSDGQRYSYIDRNFFATDGHNFKFMGGARSLMPVDSEEYRQGRNHGSKFTTWGEITD